MSEKNTWTFLTMCKQIGSNNSFKNKVMTTNEKYSSPSLSGETSEKRLMSYIFHIDNLQSNVQIWKIADAMKRSISTYTGSLHLVDKFTYHRSSVSSPENNINTQRAKLWTVTDRLSAIWKSDLTDKIKRSIYQAPVVSMLLYGSTTLTYRKKACLLLH